MTKLVRCCSYQGANSGRWVHVSCGTFFVQQYHHHLPNVDYIQEPIVVVGDSKGCVHSLKLSPNLRQKTKVKAKKNIKVKAKKVKAKKNAKKAKAEKT